MPHTLHERRPQNNKETQRNSYTDYTQQTKQRRERLRGENREPGLGEAAGWQEISEPTLRETETLSPDPFFVPAYGSEDDRKAMASNTPRELRERTQFCEEDCYQAEQLVRDTTASDAIKEAWMRLIHAENYLARGVTAFLPRMQREESNPTFEHPEN